MDGQPTRPIAAENLDVAGLFAAHGASLYRFARSVLLNRDDAEDVVQEAFLRLVAHLDRSGDTRNLEGWLFTVTANACRDLIRSRRRWIPWAPEHDRPVNPVDRVANERLEMLEAAARRLPARDRLLIALRNRGSSYREIAASAGIREGSVGRLLARAVSRWEGECRREMESRHVNLLDGHGAAEAGRR